MTEGVRILFVCSEYPPASHGGIGTATALLAQGLQGRGHQVTVVGLYGNQKGIKHECDAGGVEVWRIPASKRRFAWIVGRLRLLALVRKAVRRRMTDLIEVPDWEAPAAGWPALRIPVVTRLHGSGSYFAAELGLPIRRRLFLMERASLRRTDFVCSVSKYTERRTHELYKLGSKPTEVIYNAVEVGQVPSWEARSEAKVVFAGTLTAKKGVLSLARAWSGVAAKVKSAVLHIYGRDGMTDRGTSMASHLRKILGSAVGRSVYLHGNVSREHLFDAFASSRVAVFPSYAEAFAMVPLEAMSAGCPTVYSSKGSGPELMRHGSDGLLIDPDNPDEIAAAIVSIIQDETLARTLSVNGRSRIKEAFGIEGFLSKNECFYKRCMNTFARSADVDLQ